MKNSATGLGKDWQQKNIKRNCITLQFACYHSTTWLSDEILTGKPGTCYHVHVLMWKGNTWLVCLVIYIWTEWQVGDTLLAVNSQSVEHAGLKVVVRLLLGPAGSQVLAKLCIYKSVFFSFQTSISERTNSCKKIFLLACEQIREQTV